MQRYFSHICDGTDWKRSCRHFVVLFDVPVQAPTLLYGYSEKPPHLVSFYDTLGLRRTYSHLKPPGSPQGIFLFQTNNYIFKKTNSQIRMNYWKKFRWDLNQRPLAYNANVLTPVLSPDFWISNTPRYFSFASNTRVISAVTNYPLNVIDEQVNVCSTGRGEVNLLFNVTINDVSVIYPREGPGG